MPSTDTDVEADILALVADKTGYPADMLALDLDLEADLGIDTVKQAEVFATIREHYGIERDDQLKLRDYPTLAHVIGFVRDRTPTTTTTTPTTTTPAPEPAASRPQVDVADVTEADRFPRRVPSLTIRPLLEACAPTGVKLAAGTRVVVMVDHGGVGSALAERLTERGVEVLTIDGQLDAESVVARIDGWLSAGPIHGVYWLPALDDEGAIESMDLAGVARGHSDHGSSCCMPRCGSSTSRSRSRARSSSPRLDSAAGTATTRPVQPRQWVAP